MLLVPRAPQVSSINSSTLKSTGYSSSFVNTQTLRFFKLRCSIQRLHAKGPGTWGSIACSTSAVEDNHGDQNVKSRAATTSRIRFAPIETYPWDKLTTKLMLQFADAVWFVGKWLAVPALILVALRDVFFTVKAGEELSIPFGLLVGTVLTGVLKETLSNLSINFQHSVLPWHLVELGLLFVLLRICATVMDSSFQAFIAIGGLWQTIRFALDWKARKQDPVHEEEDS